MDGEMIKTQTGGGSGHYWGRKRGYGVFGMQLSNSVADKYYCTNFGVNGKQTKRRDGIP